MTKLFVLANEATAARRRVYFHLVDATDGITAETGEAGGQPQVSSDGGAWTNTGIGTLSAIGNGRYYADLTQTLVQTAGTQIETRYKSANTAECPGDSVQVVAFDPNDTVRLGLTALPNAAADAAGGLPISDAGGLDLDAKIGALTYGTANRVNVQVYGVETGAITAGAIAADAIGASELAADAVAEIADAVWDEATLGHTTSGTFGEQLKTDVDAILVDTAEIGAAGAGLTEAGGTGDHLTAIDLPDQTMNITGNITGNLSGSVGSVTGAVGSVTGNVGGNVVGSVASVTGAVGSVTGNVGGNVTGSVGSVAAGGITATSLASDTITAAKIADDAITAAKIAADAIGSSELAASAISEIWTTALTEAYNTDGAAPTPAQALFVIMQALTEMNISGTTMTVKKLDGSTTAFTLTLNDATTPTAVTRAT